MLKFQTKDTYDRANTPSYWNTKWSSKKTRVETYSMNRTAFHIKRLNPDSVLDIGCGDGRLLARVDENIYRFGIDISETAIKRMWNQYKIPGVAMSCYNIDKLEMNFDFIAANHLLEHLSRDEEFLRKCKDILNVKKYFICAVPNNMSPPEEDKEHIRMYTRKSLEELLIKVFRNAQMSLLGNHLIGLCQKRDS